MSEISSENLGAHYTTQTKVERPAYIVANPPAEVPVKNVYNDREATKKWNEINTDIYEGTKAQKKNPAKKFWKAFGAFVLAVLAFIGVKKLFFK